MQTAAFVIFLKYPQPGAVKTRLAGDIGFEKATVVYQKMLRILVAELAENLSRDQFTTYLYCDPFREESEYQKLFSQHSHQVRMQSGDDLGARMQNALREVLGEHPTALLIGTDCVEVSASLLRISQQHLAKDSDLVLGPAEDGGYYLIGMNRLYGGLFDAMAWSTPNVYEETLKKAEALGLRTYVLPVLTDIDTLADLNRVKTRIPGLHPE